MIGSESEFVQRDGWSEIQGSGFYVYLKLIRKLNGKLYFSIESVGVEGEEGFTVGMGIWLKGRRFEVIWFVGMRKYIKPTSIFV